jgi:hypothetical protein
LALKVDIKCSRREAYYPKGATVTASRVTKLVALQMGVSG